MEGLHVSDPGRIGHYRLLGRLGEGGMGRVFLGTSRGGRKVAIKVVHPQYASDPEFRQRFAREVAAARQVGGFHTALVVDADPDADPPWMATAYIPGPSLADAIAQQGPLEPTSICQLGAALAEGLAAIHACGIIHRDLKPGNVILADDGPRIIDFGIAKAADTTSITESQVVIGTLRHMSPEQLQGLELTSQSDVFALGAILAYAATGHDPFDAPTIPAVINRIINDSPNLGLLPGSLCDIIGACLAKNPDDRPSPSDLLAIFDPDDGSKPDAPDIPNLHLAGGTIPGHLRTHPVGPMRPSRHEASEGSTLTVSPALAPRQAKPRPQPTTVRPPSVCEKPATPTREIRRHPDRRPVILATVIIAAAASLTALSASLIGRHSAGYLWATAVLTVPTSKAVQSVAFGPGNTLATSDLDGNTYLWNTSTRQITTTLTDPTSKGVDSVAFGPGNTLATSDLNGNTYLWNTSTRQITTTLTDPTSAGVDSVAFGAGNTLATGDLNGNTYLWNTSTRHITTTYTPTSNPISQGIDSVAFGSGGILASGDINGYAYLRQVQGTLVIANPTNGGSADSVAFGPGGTLLAVGQRNGAIEFYNTVTKKFAAAGLNDPVRAGRPNNGIVSMAFGPGGTTLATADQTGNAYLWNLATGTITTTFPAAANAGGTATVAFGPGGATLATSDGSNTIYLWPIAGHKP